MHTYIHIYIDTQRDTQTHVHIYTESYKSLSTFCGHLNTPGTHTQRERGRGKEGGRKGERGFFKKKIVAVSPCIQLYQCK